MNEREWMDRLARRAIAGLAGLACAAAAGAADLPAPPAADGFQVMHEFTGPEGGFPVVGLTVGRGSVLRGTTQGFALFNIGTAYAMTTRGRTRLVHAFDGATDGADPSAEITDGPDGAWYTTCNGGGAHGYGTVVRIDAQATRVLHDFDPANGDGAFPQGHLLLAGDGALYGTTPSGGSHAHGTIFRITPGGRYEIVHDFGSVPDDGDEPESGLVQGLDGRLYGTTALGGPAGAGTAFSLAPDGTYTVVHRFDGNDAFHPGGMIQMSDGAFYGLSAGDTSHPGTAFGMLPDGTTWTLHLFPWSSPQPEGYAPHGALLFGQDHYFYGVTGYGAAAGHGSVFRMDGGGTVTVVHVMADAPSPLGSLVQPADGFLYGTTLLGGAQNLGYVYRVSPLR